MRFLDIECKSPLYTHFTETLEGLSTVRAFGWQKPFLQDNLARLDTSQRPFYLLYCIQRWLNLVLLFLVGVMAVAVIAFATNLQGTTSASRLGVSLSAVVTFNQNLAILMQYWTQMETSLGAVARVKGFEEGTENENTAEETFVPSEEWPTRGVIEFRGVSASYG
jgi:ATP-binding cassette subfamily C (CFTR/MRP) protein 1